MSKKKRYTSPRLAELAPDDPRAVRLRLALLEELQRRAREPKPT